MQGDAQALCREDAADRPRVDRARGARARAVPAGTTQFLPRASCSRALPCQIVEPANLIAEAFKEATYKPNSRAAYGGVKAVLNRHVHLNIAAHPELATTAARLGATLARRSKL